MRTALRRVQVVVLLVLAGLSLPARAAEPAAAAHVGIREFESPGLPFDHAVLPAGMASALGRAEKLTAQLRGGAAAGKNLHALSREVQGVGNDLREAAKMPDQLTDTQRDTMESSSARLVDALRENLDGLRGGKHGDRRRMAHGIRALNRFLAATRQHTLHAKASGSVLRVKELWDVDPKAYVDEVRGGSEPVPGAPRLVLDDGRVVVRDADMVSNWDRPALQGVMDRISYRDGLRLWIGTEEKGRHPYIQVGITGPDNYPTDALDLPDMVVFGRKWYIPKDYSLSHVLQTAVLALKAAEEHEAREKLTYTDATGVTTTPRSGHADAPMHAAWVGTNARSNQDESIANRAQVARFLQRVKFAGRDLELKTFETMRTSRKVHLVIALGPRPEGRRAELLDEQPPLDIILERNTQGGVFDGVLDAILTAYGRHVEDHFAFDGTRPFNRWDHPAQEIAGGMAWRREGSGRAAHPDFRGIQTKLGEPGLRVAGPGGAGAPRAGSLVETP